MLRVITTLVLSLLLAAIAQMSFAQQGGTTRYLYDLNGRLRAVISPSGEAAIYEYDPAGNFTAIRRLGVNDCEAIEFTPRQGTFGAKVTIYGVGFKGQVSQVTFNGLPGRIISQTPSLVVVEVPNNATSGPISVAAPCGTRTLLGQFTVSGVRISPETITLLPNRTVAFTAIVAGIIDPAVEWSVNGIKGGNDALGKISESGFYIAPNISPSAQILIRAAIMTEPTLFGEAVVKIAGANANEVLSTAVSVRYGPLPPNNNVPPEVEAFAVSVRYGPLPPNNNVAAELASRAVSVRYGQAASNISSNAEGTEGLNRAAPVISSVSVFPDQSLTLIINGKNLLGVSEIKIINTEGLPEPDLEATKIIIRGDGEWLKANVVLKQGMPRGRFIVQAINSTGSSAIDATVANTIEIIP